MFEARFGIPLFDRGQAPPSVATKDRPSRDREPRSCAVRKRTCRYLWPCAPLRPPRSISVPVQSSFWCNLATTAKQLWSMTSLCVRRVGLTFNPPLLQSYGSARAYHFTNLALEAF